MATLPYVDETVIRERSSTSSFQRGQEYYERGLVGDLVQRDAVLQATVQGSDVRPYLVTVALSDDGVSATSCTCLYDQGGWCKHVVATLLAVLHAPEEVEQRSSLRDLLAGTDRVVLLSLLLKLVEHEPRLADRLESEVMKLNLTSTASPTPLTKLPTVDAKVIGREVRAIHQGRGGSLFALLEQADALLEAGAGDEALAFLEALTEANVAGENFEMWEGRHDIEDEPNAFLTQLGSAWATALLTVDLTARERQDWAAKLELWRTDPADYGYEDVFDVAVEAALQGWADPALQRVLQGQSTAPISLFSDSDEWSYWKDDLTQIRLAVLGRQDRHEEYLRLSAAEGRVVAHATMLVRLQRQQEAVAYGLAHLRSPNDALALAQSLQDGDEEKGARRIAAHGLTLEGHKERLATWLRDLALAVGDAQQALVATIEVFKENPDLPIYQQVRELDEEGWPARRAALLEYLRQASSTLYFGSPADIFLYEGLIDDAIAVVDQYAARVVIERVVAAAVASRPEWAIKAARGQADPIMKGGKSQDYEAAARWLAYARDAYRAAGRVTEWQAYYGELLATHSRKYKLMPLLEKLR